MTLEQIIEKGLALGLEAVEVYASTRESNTLKVNDGNLESYNMSDILGISIRGLLDGKMAYVYAESYDEETITTALNNLVANVKVIGVTEPEFMFEGGATYTEVPVVESDYKQHTTDEKIALLKDIEKQILAKDERIVKVGYCQYTEVSSNVQIINSKGLNLKKSNSYISTFAGALATDGKDTYTGFSGDVNFSFDKLEKSKIIDEAAKTALDQIGAGFVQSGKYPVVLHRDVASQIVGAFASVFVGDSAIRKMTILTDKIGEKVFGDNITLIDDPFTDKALIKTPFDDEGVPCNTKNIVENGVFKGFMHSLKTANFYGVAPTGNGFKAGAAGGVSTSPVNLYLQEGSLSKDEIIATVEKGIYVTDVAGLHAGLNPISGDFNVQSKGFLIENGKLGAPITLFVVSGNFFEMMNNVEEIGNDIEERFNGVASPTLKIKSLAISGK